MVRWMRQRVVAQARVRGLLIAAVALAALGCSFDPGAIPPNGKPSAMNESDGGKHDARTEDAREPMRDADPPRLDARPPAQDAAPDAAPDATPPAPDAAPDANIDAAVDAAMPDDDAEVPEPDAGEDAGEDAGQDAGCEPNPGPCVCPHEEFADGNGNGNGNGNDDECPPPLCPVADCAPDDTCRFLTFQSSGYYFCDDERTWGQARDLCDTIANGHLVNIESAAEDQFVLEQIDAKTWLGGDDIEQEGQWNWSSGDAFFDEDEDEPVDDAFVNWHSSEPNNTGLSQSAPDCLMYWFENVTWADASCGDEHGYVCEID
jgi:hypothetical protein